MRTLLLTCLLSIVLTTLHAQEVINLWPDGQIPNAIAGVPNEEKAEAGSDGIARISNVSIPTLTVYKPAGKVTGSAVMVCPGGGYSILASGHEGEDIAHWLNGMGVTAFVLKYRLPNDKMMTNQQEVPLMDAMQGMTLIRQKAGQYGVDPNRIGVMGFSAGGHLASTLATHYNKGPKASEQAKPNFAILIYPVITFGANTHSGSKNNLLGKLNTSPEMVAYYSNELQVTDKTPTTFLVHSADDKAVPVQNSIDFYLACLKNNVPVEMHLYPRGGHGYGLRTAKHGSLNTWPDTCKAWLASLGML